MNVCTPLHTTFLNDVFFCRNSCNYMPTIYVFLDPFMFQSNSTEKCLLIIQIISNNVLTKMNEKKEKESCEYALSTLQEKSKYESKNAKKISSMNRYIINDHGYKYLFVLLVFIVSHLAYK